MNKEELKTFEFTKFRKEMNAAYTEIIKRRDYKGARIDDILVWLADYCENRITQLEKENADLKSDLDDAKEQVEYQKSCATHLNSAANLFKSERDNLTAQLSTATEGLKEIYDSSVENGLEMRLTARETLKNIGVEYGKA